MNDFEKFLVDRTFNEICHDYYANFQCGSKCPFYNNSFTDQCDCGQKIDWSVGGSENG